MKKLISILGAMGIVASSAASVVACGGKGGSDNLNSQEKEALMATESMSKIMLQSKSENLGTNSVEQLGEHTSATSAWSKGSPYYLSRFQNASNNGNDQYSKEMATTYQSWIDNFAKNVTDNAFDLKTTDTTSFINQDSLEGVSRTANGSDKGLDYTSGNGKLSYLLSDSERNTLANDRKNDYLYAQSASSSPVKGGLLDTVKSNMSAVKSSTTGFLTNPEPGQISTFMGWVTKMLAFTTNGDGFEGKGEGGLLMEIIVGGYWNENDTSLSKYSRPNIKGQNMGLVPVAIEKEWQWLVEHKDEAVQQMGESLYNYIVGSNIDGKDYLIDELPTDNGATYEYNAAYERRKIGTGYIDYKDKNGTVKKTTNLKWFTSYNDGLMGKLINVLGEMKYHAKFQEGDYDGDGLKYGVNDADYNTYLSGKETAGSFYHEDVQMMDEDVVTMMRYSTELYDLTRKSLNEDTFKDMLSNAIDVTSGYEFISSLGSAGIKLTSDTFLLFTDFMEELSNSVVYFDKTKLDNLSNDEIANDADSIFSRENFDTSVIEEIRNSTKLKPAYEWTSDTNAEYRHVLEKAFGVDGNSWATTAHERMYPTLKKLVSDSKYVDLISKIGDMKVAKNWIADNLDKPLFDETIWKASDEKVTYKDSGEINEVEFTLNYNGVGNDAVAKFKAENFDMDQNEILNKLSVITNDKKKKVHRDEEFASSYLGDGSIPTKNVKRKYTVKWINNGTGMTGTNLVLTDITSTQAYIDGAWENILV